MNECTFRNYRIDSKGSFHVYINLLYRCLLEWRRRRDISKTQEEQINNILIDYKNQMPTEIHRSIPQ